MLQRLLIDKELITKKNLSMADKNASMRFDNKAKR